MERREEYVITGGERTPIRRIGARLVSAQSVINAVRKVGSPIDVRYFVATAQHESGFAVNEWDTEPNGFQSVGIYQISRAEAVAAGFMLDDMLDLLSATQAMVMLAGRHLEQLVAAAPHASAAELRAYLSIAHNQGMGDAEKGTGALGTIHHHGLDWNAYRTRNLAHAEANVAANVPGALHELAWWHKVIEYGQDCSSGGPFFPTTYPPDMA